MKNYWPLRKSKTFKNPYKNPDAFLDNHNVWVLACDDYDECNELSKLNEIFYEEHCYFDIKEDEFAVQYPLNIRDFLLLYNVDTDTVDYIGRIVSVSSFNDSNSIIYKYRCSLEWAEIDPVDVPEYFNYYDEAENPTMITDKSERRFWKNVILDQIVE